MILISIEFLFNLTIYKSVSSIEADYLASIELTLLSILVVTKIATFSLKCIKPIKIFPTILIKYVIKSCRYWLQQCDIRGVFEICKGNNLNKLVCRCSCTVIFVKEYFTYFVVISSS